MGTNQRDILGKHSTEALRAGELISPLYSEASLRLLENIGIFNSDSLSTLIPSTATAYVFAGAVRDALWSVLHRRKLIPKDYDIGIGGLTESEFINLGLKIKGEPNRYGGYKVRSSIGPTFELWRLECTVGVVLNHEKANVENVLRSFILDVNAIGFDLKNKIMIDNGSLNALKKRQIDLVATPLFHNHSIFAARAILLALRLSFTLSLNLQGFIQEFFDRKAFAYELEKLANTWSRQAISETVTKQDLSNMATLDLLQTVHEVAQFKRVG